MTYLLITPLKSFMIIRKDTPGIIHLFQNSRRLGYNQNFLSAYQKANGYYIASADQDDIWETNKIEILIREIGDSTLIFHNSVLFNQKNPNMGLLHKKDWGEHPHPLSVLVNPKKHTGIRFFFRREVLPLIHQFETYNVSYDSLVYTLCSSMGDVKYINQVLCTLAQARKRKHLYEQTGKQE